MSLRGKWKVIEDLKRLRNQYGENTKVASRALPETKRTPKAHSFAHLIDVEFTVPQPKWRVIDGPLQKYTEFRITDRDVRLQFQRNEKLRREKLDLDEFDEEE